MKYAILAAGEGSRLVKEGIATPKPLVKLNGEIMIDRLVRTFMLNDAESIIVIISTASDAVLSHINSLKSQGIPIRLIVRSTPSSMHSFYELHQWLGNGKFCLTTVDTIFNEDEFAEYIALWQQEPEDVDGLMAVTEFVDDEKPLWISADDTLRIRGFYDTKTPDAQYVSGGMYCLNEKSFPTLNRCMAEGLSRMRNFQRQMVADGLKLKAHRFSKILDIDHVSDIVKAEEFLKGNS